MANKYFYLKLGKGNKDAEDCLSGQKYFKKPCAAIYFGNERVNDLLKDIGNIQAINFCKVSLPKNRKDTYILIINNGKLWIAQPKSEVSEFQISKNEIHKVFELTFIKKEVPLSSVPPVLASINANRYLSSGTFRQIRKRGNIKAIRAVLNKEIPQKYYTEKYKKAQYLLECLSSTELETLIAKIFEANGCFVPAYRGGNMKDIDLFVHNHSSQNINIDGLKIKHHSAVSIQVKINIKTTEKIYSNYSISLNNKNIPNHFNAEWILKNLKAKKNVADWLKLSLSWLSKDYLKYFNI